MKNEIQYYDSITIYYYETAAWLYQCVDLILLCSIEI